MDHGHGLCSPLKTEEVVQRDAVGQKVRKVRVEEWSKKDGCDTSTEKWLRLRVAELDWANPLLACLERNDNYAETVVFGSECVYDPAAVPYLINTMEALATTNRTVVRFYLSFGRQRKEAEELFFATLQQRNSTARHRESSG